MNKKKIFIIIALLIAVFVGYKVVYFYTYQSYASKCIENYMEKQGIKKQDITKDSGVFLDRKWGAFKRNIKLKNSSEGEIWYGVIYTKNPIKRYKKMTAQDKENYEGVIYSNTEFSKILNKDGNPYSKGELDKNGKLIAPLD